MTQHTDDLYQHEIGLSHRPNGTFVIRRSIDARIVLRQTERRFSSLFCSTEIKVSFGYVD